MPEISVIIPVYKSEAYLARCIDSILAQTFSDYELILVDDGSPDRCGAICDEYAMLDSRIKVIHKKNGGVSSARNAALDVATGTSIAFVDSDDTVTEKYLEDLMRWREYDYVTAGFMWQDSQNNWHTRVFEEVDAAVDTIRAMPSQYLGKHYFGSPWATLMKRSIIEENVLRFDTNIHSGEDTLFIINYLNYAHTVKIVPTCGYYYHYYPTSLVNRLHADYWKWRITVEQAIGKLFSAAEESQCVFLLDRQFEVLKELISRYDAMDSPELLKTIFTYAFFDACISHKKKCGNMSEKFFIFSIRKGRYTLYKKLNPFFITVGRMKHRLHRLFM